MSLRKALVVSGVLFGAQHLQVCKRTTARLACALLSPAPRQAIGPARSCEPSQYFLILTDWAASTSLCDWLFLGRPLCQLTEFACKLSLGARRSYPSDISCPFDARLRIFLALFRFLF